MTLRRIGLSGLLAIGLLAVPQGLHSQQNIEPNGTKANGPAPMAGELPGVSKEQLLTSTVHQAWLLSGKDEEKFFDMVQACAEISAMNRGITLPNSEAAGRRMGNYIKTSSKSDTNQLLFAVVDKAVVMTSKVPVHKAGTPAATK